MTAIAQKPIGKFADCIPPQGRVPYDYTILRYVHDIATGEFVNVGIVIFSVKANYFDYSLRRSLGKISDIFPDIKVAAFKAVLRGVKRRLDALQKSTGLVLEFNDRPRSFDEVLTEVLPKDDSALVWANHGTGVTADLQSTLSRLFDRYVAKYDRPKQKRGRTDEDVARSVKKKLEERHLLNFFEEKTIQGKSDDIKFDFAWKNGIWHCIGPVSFDLSEPENIREKAHKCAGEIVGISDSPDKFKVYLILGKPDRPDLIDAFERAKGILDNVRSAKTYVEDEQESLFDELSQNISSHNRLSN